MWSSTYVLIYSSVFLVSDLNGRCVTQEYGIHANLTVKKQDTLHRASFLFFDQIIKYTQQLYTSNVWKIRKQFISEQKLERWDLQLIERIQSKKFRKLTYKLLL